MWIINFTSLVSNILVLFQFSSGTVEDTELADGLIIDRRTESMAGVHKVEKAKIALIQFCVSPPKTDVSI